MIYANESVIRTAVRGCSASGRPWLDPHLWADAEVDRLSRLDSEDYERDRMLGTDRIVDPFSDLAR